MPQDQLECEGGGAGGGGRGGVPTAAATASQLGLVELVAAAGGPWEGRSTADLVVAYCRIAAKQRQAGGGQRRAATGCCTEFTATGDRSRQGGAGRGRA